MIVEKLFNNFQLKEKIVPNNLDQFGFSFPHKKIKLHKGDEPLIGRFLEIREKVSRNVNIACLLHLKDGQNRNENEWKLHPIFFPRSEF